MVWCCVMIEGGRLIGVTVEGSIVGRQRKRAYYT